MKKHISSWLFAFSADNSDGNQSLNVVQVNLKLQFFIKSGYYIVPSPSTALIWICLGFVWDSLWFVWVFIRFLLWIHGSLWGSLVIFGYWLQIGKIFDALKMAKFQKISQSDLFCKRCLGFEYKLGKCRTDAI